MKIPRLGPGERAVNVIGFEVCRTVLGALAQGRHHPTLVAYGDVETTPYLVMEFVDGVAAERLARPRADAARRRSRGWVRGDGARACTSFIGRTSCTSTSSRPTWCFARAAKRC